MQQEQTKSIFVAIVGRPNVGKSSLLNRMVGEKVAIVTAKPQTTRTRITGILTRGAVQYVFLDTLASTAHAPGWASAWQKATADSVAEVDAVVMLFEPYGELTEAEQALVEDIRVKKVPALAAVNKTDTLKKTDLAVRMQFLEELGVFRGVLPLCVSEDRAVRNCWTHCCLSRWKALTISRTTPTPTCRKRLSWRRCCGKRCC